MTNVTIHRCPACPRLGELAAAVAGSLRSEADTTVGVVEGQEGEFRVDVDDANVYSLAGPTRPTCDEVLAAVRSASTTGVGKPTGPPRVGGGEGI